MRNLKFQAVKKAKPETYPKSVILEEYHNLLDMFSKNDSDTFSFYWKYVHEIILEKE